MTARPVYPIHPPGQGRATTDQVVDGLGRLADALDSMDDVQGMTILEERLSTIDTSGGGWYRHLVRGLEDTITDLLNRHKRGESYGFSAQQRSDNIQGMLSQVLLSLHRQPTPSPRLGYPRVQPKIKNE